MQKFTKQKDLLFIRQLKSIITSKNVLVSIFVTLCLILFFNFISKIPLPYIKVEQGSSENALLNMMNLLGGGGLTSMSIFATGISPYITTQIIMQLLSSDIIPPLSRLAKTGERGRKKIEVITRSLTIIFAVVQAYSIIAMLSTSGNISFKGEVGKPIPTEFIIVYVIMMVAGTYISIFISDLITKKGVGNGVTTIILSGIVSSLIGNFMLVRENINAHTSGDLYQIMAFIIYIIFYMMVLWTITFISCSSRKIPIQQTGQSLIKIADDLPYLPFKLNTGGVIPVIFSSSLMTLPLTISQIIETTPNGADNGFVIFANAVFSFQSVGGLITYSTLIILFTFFYSYVQINPNKISIDFMKSGRFIIGVKIGVTTEKYISKILYRINWIGGPFLALVTSLPYIASLVTNQMIPSMAALGGTGIIIMVSGTIDIWQAIVSASITSSYTIKRKQISAMNSNIEVEKQLEGQSLW